MGLSEIQEALARLAIDPALRDRFFADPAEVGANLGLAAPQALGLAQISRRQVEQFAESLRRKRRAQVRRVIPLAARALGQQFAPLFERYMDGSAPRGSKADLDDAAGFVASLGRWGEHVQPEWAADLARYELAWSQAARAGRAPMVRIFRFPVARLATKREQKPIGRRPSLACWWRPTPRGTVRHFVISMPRLGFRRG
jgi:hypothetical protein